MRMLIIAILLIYIFYFPRTNPKCSNKTEIIKTLIRQASRWSTAAEQDQNVMIAVLHANYGAGYLWALKDIATDQEIEDVMKIDVLKFKNEIIRIQDLVTKRMIKLCPEYAPDPTYISKLAGEGI